MPGEHRDGDITQRALFLWWCTAHGWALHQWRGISYFAGCTQFFFFFKLNPTDVEGDVQSVSVWRSNGAVRVWCQKKKTCAAKLYAFSINISEVHIKRNVDASSKQNAGKFYFGQNRWGTSMLLSKSTTELRISTREQASVIKYK